jgi:hypothetical protein
MVHRRDTVDHMVGRLVCLAAILGLAQGCYTPPEPDCGFVCGPNGECPDDYSCAADNVCHRKGAPATLTCTTNALPFDVQSVQANGAHAVTVVFDSAPTAAQATDPANYAIPGLTITGTPTLSGASVMLTTSAQMAMTYTLTVSNVTRASDGAALTTAVGMFPGIPAFDVTTAMSVDAQTLAVTFSDAPDPTQSVDPANYTINGLTISGTPTLAGNTVTVTTAQQMAQSYTVTVSNVKRASDFEPLDMNSAMFVGRNAFIVTGAASTSHTTMTVTFSAPPDQTKATTRANYAVAGLTLSGTPTLAGNTVTITTAGQAGTNYTVNVTNVTRAADAEPLATGAASATFAGRTAFGVASAASVSNTSITVTFSAAPDPTSAGMLANYAVAGLTLSGTPSLAGNTVTITTASQAPTNYTVTVANVTRNTDGEALTTTSAAFTGRAPFNVVSAAPQFTGELTVTFSDPPEPTSATTLANYSCDGGLTFTGTPTLAGSAVKLTTSSQIGAHTYTLTVANVTRNTDGEPLTTTMAMWNGVACNDAMKDGDETDIDCGGSVCAPCANGQMCIVNADCVSNNCQTMVCAP